MIKEKDYLVTNQEILGGLKSAIERGEDLKKAMMTFYRAGYSKEEIEEAAKVYLEMTKESESLDLKRIPEKKEETKKSEKEGDVKKGKEKKFSILGEKQKPVERLADEIKEKKETVQKVSSYEPKEKPKKSPAGKTITFILIAVLLILLGLLAAVVLFKEELVTFFNNLFG